MKMFFEDVNEAEWNDLILNDLMNMNNYGLTEATSRLAGHLSSSGTYDIRQNEMMSKNDSKKQKLIKCLVLFLDDSQHTFEVEKRSKGEQLMDLVFRHLELIEKDYFGLEFMDKETRVCVNCVYFLLIMLLYCLAMAWSNQINYQTTQTTVFILF